MKLPDETSRLLTEAFPDETERAAAYRRVDSGEPLAYVTGRAYFYDEIYHVTPDCLIPRPDTERLVEKAVAFCAGRKCGQTMLDLCTGSGCIAISTAAHCPNISALGVDISASALDVAAKNAALNGVSERVTFREGDIFEPDGITGIYDIITANPPYIESGVIDTLDEAVRREPRIALDGGADGMDFYRAILSAFPVKLKPDGAILLEIGYDQGGRIKSLSAEHGFDCAVYRDYGGNDRVAVLRRL